MSDYMFMLESHLSPEQNRTVALLEAAAEQAGVNAFLVGGAVRDMMGGFPIRDLDFCIEGNASKLAKTLVQKHGCKIFSQDEDRRTVEMQFPAGVTAEIATAHEARYPKPGAKPIIKAATIHDHLKGRDFTMNSVALSLTKASRGLLLDPNNGLGDLERRELRVNGNHTLYDDPARILRMFRLKTRMGLELSERTQSQYANVREAQLEIKIPRRAFVEELRRMADEPNPGQLLETLDKEGLLHLFSPVLAGANLNLAGFLKLERNRQMVPFGVPFKFENTGLFLWVLTEKLSAREKSQLISSLGIPKADVAKWQKLEADSKKLEKTLKSAKLKKASLVYLALRPVPGEQILFLLMRSGERIVHDRLKNYLQKYLVTVL